MKSGITMSAMKMFGKWLKKIVLPFESPDHPLYADPTAIQQREIERERIQNLSDEEIFSDFEEGDQDLVEELLIAKSDHSNTFRGDR